MTRRMLPARRPSETVKFRLDGRSFIATVGYFPDGKIGELFLVAGKAGSDADIAARDLGLAVSLALQFGCPIATLRAACAKRGAGHDGPLGRLLDMLAVPA